MRAVTATLAALLAVGALAQPTPAAAPKTGGANAPAAAPKAGAANTPAGAAVAASPASVGAFRDCPTCPEMVIVPAGTFLLGSAGDSAEAQPARGETPAVPITISRAFAIAKYEVTVAEFRAFVTASQYASPSDCRVARGGAWLRLPDRNWSDPGFGVPQADNEPVVCVSWDDAAAYIAWLTKRTGKVYRLPSETEWEYSARGGTATPRYFGDRDSDEDTLLSVSCDYGNVFDASAVAELAFAYPNARCNDGHTYTAPVGSYKPNAFDLYDVIGNAREWLQDCYTASYVGRPPDGRAWEWAGGCELRGVRGGSWATRPADSRAAARAAEPQGLRQSDLGFRVVREL